MNSLNAMLYKNKVKYSKSRCFLISSIMITIVVKSRMFFKKTTSQLYVHGLTYLGHSSHETIIKNY